ncbi:MULTISPECIES: hypothetical protein [unclassified Rhizobacter]|uniref:hypothetical protein n=1 Tax=unclassified Rhizobacter TaxID=2640088 RepID=UPI0006F3EAF8|nr:MULTISPECIES: hypothetical protein [unclassified Rhizobacter]KQU75985.1 hypothetical protein ASC88_24095 [Rhizobacter sp. Root29]KQW08760.1 hypothetical protein ASC98_24885 [Rhizobacter sp. Root1238]KRB16330.1 hypothetical protein ASE08_25765 [Rhizobacter sp. Root16D2]
MEVDKLVTVYGYSLFDVESGQQLPSTFKAPRSVIEHDFLGVVMEGTAELVNAEALDEQGRFRRVATAWGELS